MRIGFMVNDVSTEHAGYTTVRMAMTAHNRGHQIWFIGAGDFDYDIDDQVHARAWSVTKKKYSSTKNFLNEIQGTKAVKKRIVVDDLDVLMLRNDPSNDTGTRSWAQMAGIIFGRAAMRNGVIVLNDPNALSRAMNKMYFQMFPEEVRPRTIISRDRNEIRRFIRDEGGTAVLKPLQGSGGSGVFLISKDNFYNINQIVESVSRDGYVIAQEYLPKAAEGDTRMFLLNGMPLRHKGKYAAFCRVRAGDDIRSNIHAGGSLKRAEITEQHLRVAEIVRPKLVQDGMFLVGLDIVGDKLMEINVFSPGGLGSAQKFEKVNFNDAVIDSLERKVKYMEYYRRNFDNIEMSTL
ncbi:Glutathione synthetase [Limihaloglobus sulfuriphilus]|uniref:Glutathione synthetase n=1 Tax=Limihaloglobus sulfuriphilus TaxID=1851148 RepID=A0A1Q2MBP4_9BACT|nr:glutathione synthase [Limihaloglobus sulfuriphilus]AQQ69697.1 Glutathione synthetase [Limihaloglobus sulfuriphilus]